MRNLCPRQPVKLGHATSHKKGWLPRALRASLSPALEAQGAAGQEEQELLFCAKLNVLAERVGRNPARPLDPLWETALVPVFAKSWHSVHFSSASNSSIHCPTIPLDCIRSFVRRPLSNRAASQTPKGSYVHDSHCAL